MEDTIAPIPFDTALRDPSLAAVWTVLASQVSAKPRPTCQPALWRYRDVRPLPIRAGEEVSAKQAERRVLLFRNPGLDRPAVTHTRASGLQRIKGGEIEGDGVYTAVEGERIWPDGLDVPPVYTLQVPFPEELDHAPPPISRYSLEACSEAVLFSFSDRAAREAPGVWREQRTGPHA